jgi:hypothetical protein
MSAKRQRSDYKPDQNLIVRVPLKMKRRGGRKSVLPPSQREQNASHPGINPFVRKLALAFRWRARIESGEFATITDLAKAECVNQSYACRLLRLSLLAPDLVEAAINFQISSQAAAVALAGLPNGWASQATLLGREN